ncbi:SDR family NAD(P)-dependent oxidoreductase [Marinicrinis sediminis]|uniref:SDR family NAD(P)-dependent oxidoreductase n=1 Tax=Marinicrinis sediminis TaxID=1652465 RepID=A0ABW5R7S7_9BACL
MRLKGKVALVTGGSRGLGKVMSQVLASEGAYVIVNYAHQPEAAEQVVRDIQSRNGQAAACQADVTNESSVYQLIEQAEKLAGSSIDIVINNATGAQPTKSMAQSTWEDYLQQLNFSVKGPLYILQAVWPSMKEKGRGSIIHIGSEVIHNGPAHFAHYATAKSAMLGMTRSWAQELGQHGIRVNLLNPGFIPVERHEDVGEQAIEDYRQHVPMQRMGVPMDIAQAVLFLASDDSSFITGQSITVNGGNTFGI